MQALQALSMQSRVEDAAANGYCVTAEVKTIKDQVPYHGVAQARNQMEIIPAAVLASLKATTRCGLYDSNIRDFVHGYFKVKGVRGAPIDIFISHTLRTAKLLYKYVDVCQLPPRLTLEPNVGTCIDSGL